MNKGLAIIEVNDTEVKGIHIEQEVVEFARLNAETKKHIAEAEAKKRVADQNRRKAEKAKARRREYNVRTVCYVISRCAVAGAVTWAAWAGMIHPIISITVATFCLSAACLRLGLWFGKVGK